MEHPQSYSHGLLFSIAPENISKLHLNDESKLDELDWDEMKSSSASTSFASFVLVQMKKIVRKMSI
jgi:hypothetical protein